MALFIFALTILTVIQFSYMLVIGAFVAVCVALSMGVSHLVFKLTGAPH